MTVPTPGSPRAVFAAAAEEMLGECERQRRQLGELQERMSTGSATAESPPLGMVGAMVGARGDLTAVTVHPRKFKRATAAQLGTEIVAAAAARVEAGKLVAAAMPPSPFSGVSFTDIASGELELADLLPDPSALFGGGTQRAGDGTPAGRRAEKDDGWAEAS